MYAQDNNSLPVWIILSPAHHHISINSQPFLVGIVSSHKTQCRGGLLVCSGTQILSSIAVLAASHYSCFLFSVVNPAKFFIALALPIKVGKALSTYAFCCGVPVAVYSKIMPNPSASHLYSSFLFSPALSQHINLQPRTDHIHLVWFLLQEETMFASCSLIYKHCPVSSTI